MAIAPNHWSSMDLKRLLMYLTDLGETQISMFSDFCHVVKFCGFILFCLIYYVFKKFFQIYGIFCRGLGRDYAGSGRYVAVTPFGFCKANV